MAKQLIPSQLLYPTDKWFNFSTLNFWMLRPRP
jgi:hypothetical protein